MSSKSGIPGTQNIIGAVVHWTERVGNRQKYLWLLLKNKLFSFCTFFRFIKTIKIKIAIPNILKYEMRESSRTLNSKWLRWQEFVTKTQLFQHYLLSPKSTLGVHDGCKNLWMQILVTDLAVFLTNIILAFGGQNFTNFKRWPSGKSRFFWKPNGAP